MARQLAMLGLVLVLYVSFAVQPFPTHSVEANDTRENASIEERLDTLEQKMDALIEAVSKLRQESSRTVDVDKDTIRAREEHVQLLRNARDEILVDLKKNEVMLAQLNRQGEADPQIVEDEISQLRELQRKTSHRLDALNELTERGDEATEIVSLIKRALPNADALESVETSIQLAATRDRVERELKGLEQEIAAGARILQDATSNEAERNRLRSEVERQTHLYEAVLMKLKDAERQLD